MKRLTLFLVLFFISSLFIRAQNEAQEEKQGRVTGIGGVFFLSRGNGKDLSAWYEKHLGMRLEEWGGSILQWEDDRSEDKGLTVWSVADNDSDWFAPSTSSFMINYRVDNMDALLEQLTAAEIEIVNGPEYAENGVFAWIMDPEGNKIELWEAKNWDEKNKK